jgi:hypothetical protein
MPQRALRRNRHHTMRATREKKVAATLADGGARQAA